jgi:hypothetical protein
LISAPWDGIAREPLPSLVSSSFRALLQREVRETRQRCDRPSPTFSSLRRTSDPRSEE